MKIARNEKKNVDMSTNTWNKCKSIKGKAVITEKMMQNAEKGIFLFLQIIKRFWGEMAT